jgi:hypothetical protein
VKVSTETIGALETFLDHDARAAFAVDAPNHRGGTALFASHPGFRNGNAFSEREAVRLDDDGKGTSSK